MLIATAAYLQVIGHNLGKTAKPACRCKHLQHSSQVRTIYAFALWVVRPSTKQSRLRQPSQITHSLHQFWSSITSANRAWVFESQANKMTKTWIYKIWTFWWCRTRNSFPPEDFETTLWSIATCSPNLELSGKSDSGSGTRWLQILFEKSLARLQMSHKGCFGKWLIRCSIETASALARTTASESIGRGSSGAISLTSAAPEERSPKSPGSTADSNWRIRNYWLLKKFRRRLNTEIFGRMFSSGRNSRYHFKIGLKERHMLRNPCCIDLVTFTTADLTLCRVMPCTWYGLQPGSQTKPSPFCSTSSPIDRTMGHESKTKWLAFQTGHSDLENQWKRKSPSVHHL